MSIGNVAGSGATTWAFAVQTPYDPPNPYAGTVGWPGTATVGSVPAGQWDENPPPVPDVGATIYAGEQQTSAKPSDASTARQPGDVPGDGTNPAAQSPLSASRKPMGGAVSPQRDFGFERRHRSGAELMGLTPGTSTQQVEESYQRIGGPRPNDAPGTQSNPSSPTWWAALVGGSAAFLSGTVNVVKGVVSTLVEVPAAVIDVGGIATEATARATFNTNWTYSPLSSSGQDEGGSFSEKAKNRAWEYAQQVATLGTKEFDEAYQEYLETGDPTRMQNSAGNLAGNAIGAKVGGRIIGKVRELTARGNGVAAPESTGPAPEANPGPETPTRTAPISEAMADAQAIEAFEGEGGALESGSSSARPASLSNQAARVWYNNRVQGINLDVSATEANARAIHAARNALKQQARDLMADRAAAAQLDEQYPLQDFEYYVEKYSSQGFQGEALWLRIIKGAGTPNPNVNQQFGIGGTADG